MKASLKKILGHDVFVINKTDALIKTGFKLAKDMPFSLVWNYDHRYKIFNLIFFGGTADIKDITKVFKYFDGVKKFKVKNNIAIAKVLSENLDYILDLS